MQTTINEDTRDALAMVHALATSHNLTEDTRDALAMVHALATATRGVSGEIDGR